MGKIAIVFGGNSVEHDISIITAFSVMQELNKNYEDFIPIYLSREGIFYSGKALFEKSNYQKKKGFKKGYFLPLKNYHVFKTAHRKYVIDHVLLCVHGQNVEDGTLGAFFETINIPVTYSGVFNSSLLQDKEMLKIYLKHWKIPTTKYQVITKKEFDNRLALKKLQFPKIVKPVHLGSSIGVHKVHNYEELEQALEEAFCFDNRVLIEDVVNHLIEYNIALLGQGDEVIASEIEEVNHRNEVLTFENKYEEFANVSPSRILPAIIKEEVRQEITRIAKLLFAKLDLSGVMRFDFLYDQEQQKVYLNEINTIPGSLAYYLFEPVGVPFIELLFRLVKIGKNALTTKKGMQRAYEHSNLMLLQGKK